MKEKQITSYSATAVKQNAVFVADPEKVKEVVNDITRRSKLRKDLPRMQYEMLSSEERYKSDCLRVMQKYFIEHSYIATNRNEHLAITGLSVTEFNDRCQLLEIAAMPMHDNYKGFLRSELLSIKTMQPSNERENIPMPKNRHAAPKKEQLAKGVDLFKTPEFKSDFTKAMANIKARC